MFLLCADTCDLLPGIWLSGGMYKRLHFEGRMNSIDFQGLRLKVKVMN